uniref:Uncharacterized protein n=1 Tax=Amphora coffeiformis TaxID=265554 RepID=A0A7S3LIQ4_9STRA
MVTRTIGPVLEEKQKEKFKGVYVQTILIGTLGRPQPQQHGTPNNNKSSSSSSPLLNVRDFPDVLELIFQFACPSKPDEQTFYHKMGLRMCSGTEHVHMEMLENTANNRFGSLNNDPVGDVRRGFLPKSSSKNTRGTRIARVNS